MHPVNTISGHMQAPAEARFALVAARFNEFIVNSLISGAIDALERHGVEPARIDLIWVPGSYELPLAIRRLAMSGRYHGITALGAVIRGSTPHFDYVAGECTKGIASVALSQDLPISFGVLTVDTIEQAVERAGTKAGNKGAEAALVMLEMCNLLERIAP